MSEGSVRYLANKYFMRLNNDIDPILDETYLRINHLKIKVAVLLYIFGLKIIEGRIVTSEVFNLKNIIFKLKEKGDTLVNDFNDIHIIIDFLNFIFRNYQGIYYYIDAMYKHLGGIIKPSQSIVKNILYKMVSVFIYDRELLFPFTNHNEDKKKYLINYNYNDATDQEDYTIFEKFKEKFLYKFWDLFDDLDKLIDSLKLNVIFKIKYSFLYTVVDIVIQCIFSNTDNSYLNNFDFTEQQYNERKLLDISKSYNVYYNLVNNIIEHIKEINKTLQDKLTKFNTDLNSMNITKNEIESISQNLTNYTEQMEKLSELSNNINDNINKHIEKILTTSTLTEQEINNQFGTDLSEYNNSIEKLKILF
jgi:methyl-accepting chemotaxis protein